jgi:hypothetical protein
MAMAGADVRVVLHAVLRQLVADAQWQAEEAGDGSRERDFYAGVVKAAEDRLYSSGMAARQDEAWLSSEPPGFREGYVKASTMIMTVAANPPLRLVVPTPDH